MVVSCSLSICRVGKAERAHRFCFSVGSVVGHGASALLPTPTIPNSRRETPSPGSRFRASTLSRKGRGALSPASQLPHPHVPRSSSLATIQSLPSNWSI